MTEQQTITNNINLAETLTAVKGMLTEFKGRELTQDDVTSLALKMTEKFNAENVQEAVEERTNSLLATVKKQDETLATIVDDLSEAKIEIKGLELKLATKSKDISALEEEIKQAVSLKDDAERSAEHLTTKYKDLESLSEDIAKERNELRENSLEHKATLEKAVRAEVVKIKAEWQNRIDRAELKEQDAKAELAIHKDRVRLLVD